MDQYFIILYSGDDSKIKMRLLTECGLGKEIPIETIDYFQKKKIIDHRHYEKHSFHEYIPSGATSNLLDFRTLFFNSSFMISNKTASELFKDMSSEESSSLYSDRFLSMIHFAMVERQQSPIH